MAPGFFIEKSTLGAAAEALRDRVVTQRVFQAQITGGEKFPP
jgi:hypothetical protein